MNKVLRREITLLQLVAYYFSTVVGVGIFIVPLFAAKIAGPASIVAWILSLICAYPFAMIFAHISQANQVSGSIQKFLENSWGKKFGGAIALFLVLSALFGNALLGFAAARYFNELFSCDFNVFLLGCVFLLIPMLFNMLEVGLSSKIQSIALVALVVIVEAIVITAIPHYDAKNLIPFAPNGWQAIIPAMTICFYSIVGWENVDAMAEEVKNPGASYTKAVKVAMCLIAAFYLSIAFTVIAIMNHGEILQTTTVLSAILAISMGEFSGKIGSVIAIVLLILAANAWVFGTSRIIFSLARDNVLPPLLSKISVTGLPYASILVQMIFYLAISVILVLFSVSEDTIVEVTSLNYIILYMIIFFSGFIKFKKSFYKFLSCAAMLLTFFLFCQSSMLKIGTCILMLLLCLLYTYSLKNGISSLLKRKVI